MIEATPKKQLGQHWLFDEHSLDAMVASAEVTEGDLVLEVGPGLGTLTKRLLLAKAQVWALEYDKSLIPALSKKFASYDKQFHIENVDILQYDFDTPPSGYKIVANIPYYLTSNLLRKMCEATNPFSKSALLVQKEVAERVCAQPGDMSILSVSVQFYCHVHLGDLVPASLFTPPPKVDSQILILEHRQKPLFDGVDADLFFKLVKAGFAQKRKKLKTSLGQGLAMSKDQIGDLLDSANIDGNLRAQALSLDDWYKLYLSYLS
ncbi:ribosomal RNA small subunit methyltransferase A [Candidatus Saccharibacteria bacterium]|nr:ribosomal RNA small subunit methyltransferase A [Candidatus Saccharibacteria bacterium]